MTKEGLEDSRLDWGRADSGQVEGRRPEEWRGSDFDSIFSESGNVLFGEIFVSCGSNPV